MRGTVTKSNRKRIKNARSKLSRIMIDALWYARNDDIRKHPKDAIGRTNSSSFDTSSIKGKTLDQNQQAPKRDGKTLCYHCYSKSSKRRKCTLTSQYIHLLRFKLLP